MTAEHDESHGMTDSAASAPPVASDGAAGSGFSRRALLTGATTAVPTILTLNSSAAVAWAIGSGTIGTRATVAGDQGGVLCLETKELRELKTGVYSVGSPPYVEVINMPGSPDVRYQLRTGDTNPQGQYTGPATTVYPQDVCVNGGHIEIKPAGASQFVPLQSNPQPKRALVSTSAVTSFGGNLYQRDIYDL